MLFFKKEVIIRVKKMYMKVSMRVSSTEQTLRKTNILIPYPSLTKRMDKISQYTSKRLQRC